VSGFDDALRADAVELLSTLIGIRSENPPGDEDRIVEFIQQYLADRSIRSERIPLESGRSSLVARLPGRSPGSYILCGHIDTVRADPTHWHTNPFSALREGSRIWGLGAADMKSGVAILVALVCHMEARLLPPPHDVVLVLTADEEGAYRGAASVVSAGLIDDARFLLVPEPTAGAVYVGQRGELWVEATFKGREAHGSTPSAGVNAILPASEFCLQLAEENRALSGVCGSDQTSLNIGLITGGRQVNIVPGVATVNLDFRVVTLAERDRVLSRIREVGVNLSSKWGTTFDSRIYSDRAPIVSDLGAPDVVRFLKSFSDVTGRPACPGVAPYSTDAAAVVPALGIPVVIYGPGDIQQAHRPDEYVDLEEIFETMEVIGRFISGE
jgi:succinyl-diaminopimelate desuccinylase